VILSDFFTDGLLQFCYYIRIQIGLLMKIRLTARSYAQTNLHKNISSSIDKIKTKKTTTKK